MAIAKAQALIAGSREAKKGIVPVMNRQNGFGVVGSHSVQKIGITSIIYGSVIRIALTAGPIPPN
jgi:hypothetical protein